MFHWQFAILTFFNRSINDNKLNRFKNDSIFISINTIYWFCYKVINLHETPFLNWFCYIIIVFVYLYTVLVWVVWSNKITLELHWPTWRICTWCRCWRWRWEGRFWPAPSPRWSAAPHRCSTTTLPARNKGSPCFLWYHWGSCHREYFRSNLA